MEVVFVVMTPGRIRRRGRGRGIVIGALAVLVVAAGVMWGIVRLASQRPNDVNLGRRTFNVGKATRLATQISRDGPFLFKDPLTSSAGRELYLQHLGTDAKQGWVAIEAYAPGAPREIRCILEWNRTSKEFRDPCGSVTYPADGTGLTTYPATVDSGGSVEIDLRTH
ncbi:MAG TPA: hypothetical protein VHN98_02235 [Acidimicrobiales bacterium]|nr:hypothetical protein [Acidimicrobiales bacterium]